MLKEMVVDVAQRSELGKNVSRRLRREGKIPAVVYGMKRPSVPVAVDRKTIGTILSSETGENTVIMLRLDGQEDKTRHVMIRDRQDDPVSGTLMHVDFVRVDMKRKVQVEIPLETVGLAEGVKNQGGLMDFVWRSIQISCLPVEIPETLSIDVSPMNIGDVFRVKDLQLGEEVDLITDPEQALVVISAPAVEEEEAAPAEEELAEGVEPEGEAKPPDETPGEEAES